MKRDNAAFFMLMKTQFFLTWAVLTLAATGAAQQEFSKVEIKTIHVAGNIYMLTGAGGNIGVSAGSDGILIVDDQFAPLAPKIEAALKELNPGKLKFVLNTHFHGDHTGGNAHFGREAHIVAHTNVRKRLGGAPGEAKPGLPIITFDESLSVHFNGEEIKVIHVPPAHTDSDSVIYFTGANVIHFGDTFFSGRFPNIDLAGGGDVRGYIRNVEDAIRKVPADAKLIPGHGPLSKVKELKEFRDMLVETSGIVQNAIAAGKTLDEIKAGGLPAKWKGWEAPTLKTDRWLEILYKGLSRK
jgi:cyclase